MFIKSHDGVDFSNTETRQQAERVALCGLMAVMALLTVSLFLRQLQVHLTDVQCQQPKTEFPMIIWNLGLNYSVRLDFPFMFLSPQDHLLLLKRKSNQSD